MSEGTGRLQPRRSWQEVARRLCYGVGAVVGALSVCAGLVGITRYPVANGAEILFIEGGAIFVLLGNALRDRG